MRIGIVNDSVIAVEAMRRTLTFSGTHEVAWIARDGQEAVQLCAADKPDLVLMDLVMPVMDGVQATREIMSRTPCPILVVTSSIDGNSGRAFDALGAGALDVVNTPIFQSAGATEQNDPLLSKISLLSKLIGDSGSDTGSWRASRSNEPRRDCAASLVAIGASAGGPAAVAEILSNLPHDFAPSIILIQHVDEQFAIGLADWLSGKSKLPVRVAREGDRPVSGTVLLAGTSDHMVFSDSKTIGYTPVPKDYVYRPSVDAFFHSVVLHWKNPIVGVLLTGMGRDGAKGLRALRAKGILTIAQDAATSAVYGMPKAAADIDAAAEILPIEKIAPRLNTFFNSVKRL